MRIQIVRFLLYWFFLPVVIFRHIFRKKKPFHLDSEALKRRLTKPPARKSKRENKIDTNELDKMLNTEISTENIL